MGYGLDVRGYGGREEHALSLGLFFVGEGLDDVFEGRHETHIQEPISFIEDEGIKVTEVPLDPLIAEMIEQSSRCCNEDITAVENLGLLCILVRSSNRKSNLVFW